MKARGKVITALLVALITGFIINWVMFLYEPKEKLKVKLHEVKYIERDYKTGGE